MYACAWAIWVDGDEIPTRGAFGRDCQAVGFPQYERMPDVARETGWLGRIDVLVVLGYQQIAGQASTVKKQGEHLVAAGCDTIGRYHEMPTIAWGEAQDIRPRR